MATTVDTKNELLQWGQTGFAPGFISMNFYFPETQTSVIVLENVAYDTDDLKKTFQWHTGILDIVRENLLLRNRKTNAQTGSKPKANYPYLLYLPKEHSTNKKDFPLVIYLEGGSQRGGHGYKQTSLNVKKDNYAVRLYKNLGFEIIRENSEDYLMLLKLI